MHFAIRNPHTDTDWAVFSLPAQFPSTFFLSIIPLKICILRVQGWYIRHLLPKSALRVGPFTKLSLPILLHNSTLCYYVVMLCLLGFSL